MRFGVKKKPVAFSIAKRRIGALVTAVCIDGDSLVIWRAAGATTHPAWRHVPPCTYYIRLGSRARAAGTHIDEGIINPTLRPIGLVRGYRESAPLGLSNPILCHIKRIFIRGYLYLPYRRYTHFNNRHI